MEDLLLLLNLPIQRLGEIPSADGITCMALLIGLRQIIIPGEALRGTTLGDTIT